MASELTKATGSTVLPVPVETDAGGLVRVQDESGKIYFDSSYFNPAKPGEFTAACSLETKLKWKLSTAKDKGPAPFKRESEQSNRGARRHSSAR